ncbi:MAG: AzlC family ABC transporter permease [Lachnospiraceae bacterium]|nr:AzlC family ABC transporter permease [Lachnospiraceae bacterium]
MSKREIMKYAFIKSIPILCSYLFVSMAYGILMEEAGFQWYDSLLVSLTVYTGAFQFVLTTLLSAGASILTIAATAFFMNSRQTFYSLTFVEAFGRMGRRKLYMIHTMTDETYAVNCTLELAEREKQQVMFWVALFSRCYWMLGAVAGGVLGQMIPFSMEGIDFCMTALFVIIFIDQWEKTDTHLPALAGLIVGVLCLLFFGESRFMLPALLLVSAILVFYNSLSGRKAVTGE